MAKVSYPSNSPYSTTPQGNTFMGRFVFRAIPPDSGDTLFTLLPKHKYRPDILSNDLYGSPAYYWIFAVRNPALRADPIWNFLPGLVIYVPSAGYLRKLVGG